MAQAKVSERKKSIPEQALPPWPLIPKKVFFTRGIGRHKDELRSFELALRDAGIEKLNLVHVSSILPPGCKVIPRSEGLKLLSPGQITFGVFARCSSNEPHRLIAASVGCAIPADRNAYGYLSEYHSYGENEKQAGDKAEDLAASMLASTLGIQFDDELVWDAKKEIWKISGKIVRTMSITQSGVVNGKGYTTVVAAAVFIL